MHRVHKRVVLVILFIMFLSTQIVQGFVDIDNTAWYYNDIKELKDKGVIKGYADGSYKPQHDITQSEALAVILGALGKEIDNTSNTGVHWAEGVLHTSVKEGLLESKVGFDYNKKATRGDIAIQVAKGLGLKPDNKEGAILQDTDNGYITALHSKGIITGIEENKKYYYQPDRPITRAEVGVIIKRVLDYVDGVVVDNIEEEIKEVEKPFIKRDTINPEEIDITNLDFGEMSTYKKLFLYQGYNNLTTHRIQVTQSDLKKIDESAKENIVRPAYRQVFAKYPEYYSFTNRLKYSKILRDGVAELEFYHTNSKGFTNTEIEKYREEFIKLVNKQVDEFIKEGSITSKMTDREKAKFIFDWVVDNTEYDYEFRDISYTGYGQIKNGLAVCQGYTATYNLMLKLVGVDVHGITGWVKKTGEEHIWTIAYLDGERVHIDVTWGDNRYQDEERDYRYFGADSKFMRQTHTWEKDRFGE